MNVGLYRGLTPFSSLTSPSSTDSRPNSLNYRDQSTIKYRDHAHYLILPPGDGPFAAVLFLHPGQGDRSTFVDEAVALAARGVVSLSIDALFRRPGETRSGGFSNPEHSRAMAIQTVVDLRRAVELLRSRPKVDPGRIAYVGHSLGATYGGVLAGLEERLADRSGRPRRRPYRLPLRRRPHEAATKIGRRSLHYEHGT